MGLIKQENESFQRIRTAPGSIDPGDHRYDAGSTTTTQFEDGNFQSITEDAIETLPEGERQRAEYQLFTQADLRGTDPHSDEPADHVRRLSTGQEYEVREITDHGDLIADERFVLLRIQES